MSSAANKVVVDIELRTQLDQMRSGVKEIENLFRNLNLNPGKSAQMTTMLDQAKKSLLEIEQLTDGGKIKGEDFTKVEKKVESVTKLYQQMSKELSGMSGLSDKQLSNMFSTEYLNNIKQITSAIARYNTESKQKPDTEKYRQATEEFKRQEAAVKRLTDVQRNYRIVQQAINSGNTAISHVPDAIRDEVKLWKEAAEALETYKAEQTELEAQQANLITQRDQEIAKLQEQKQTYGALKAEAEAAYRAMKGENSNYNRTGNGTFDYNGQTYQKAGFFKGKGDDEIIPSEKLQTIETDLQKVNTALEETSAKANQASTDFQNFGTSVNEAINKQVGQGSGFSKQLEEARTAASQLEQELRNMESVHAEEVFTRIKQELQSTTNLNIDWNNITNIEQLKQAMSELSDQELTRVREAFNSASSSLEKFRQQNDELTSKLASARSSLDSTASSMRQIEQLAQRGLYFFSLTNQVNLFRRAVKSAFDTVKELDKSMTETAVVTDFSVGDMWEQLPKYTETANQYNATLKDTYDVMTLYYQQGLEQNQVFQVGEQTMKMARIAGLEYAEATDRMTNALRGFNMEINTTNSEHVADVYSALAAMSASNVEELSKAMTKTASLANSANMSFDNTAAFLAQIIETTRESAETAGTALKTVIARFSEVKGLFDKNELMGEVEGEEINVNKVGEALRAAGINLNEFLTGAKGLDQIFIELAAKWDSLDLLTQRYIATMAAGSRQQSRFLALMSDNERLTELLNGAYTAAGASSQQFEKTQESLQSKLNNLKNAWDQFLMGIANSNIIKGVVDLLTQLILAINGFLNVFEKIGGSFGRIIASAALFFTTMKAGSVILTKLSKVALTAVGSMMKTGLAAKQSATLMGRLSLAINKFRTGDYGNVALKLDNSKFWKDFNQLRVSVGKEPISIQTKVDEKTARLGSIAAENAALEEQNAILAENTGLQQVDNIMDGESATTKGAETAAIWANTAAGETNQAMLNLKNGTEEDAIALTTAATSAYANQGAALIALTSEQLAKIEADLKEATTDEARNALLQKRAAMLVLNQQATKMVTASEKILEKVKAGQMTKEEAYVALEELSLSGRIAQIPTNITLASSFELLGIKIAKAAVALWAFLAPLLPAIATIGALALVIYGIVKAVQVYNDNTEEGKTALALNNVSKEAEGLGKAYDAANSALEELISSWEHFNDIHDNLDNLIQDTLAWKQALLENNQAIQDIINQYPDLAQYVKVASNGAMEFKPGGETAYQNYVYEERNRVNQLNSAQNEALAAQAFYDKKQKALDQIAETDYKNKDLLLQSARIGYYQRTGYTYDSDTGKYSKDGKDRYLSDLSEETVANYVRNNVVDPNSALSVYKDYINSIDEGLLNIQSNRKANLQADLINSGYNPEIAEAIATSQTSRYNLNEDILAIEGEKQHADKGKGKGLSNKEIQERAEEMGMYAKEGKHGDWYLYNSQQDAVDTSNAVMVIDQEGKASNDANYTDEEYRLMSERFRNTKENLVNAKEIADKVNNIEDQNSKEQVLNLMSENLAFDKNKLKTDNQDVVDALVAAYGDNYQDVIDTLENQALQNVNDINKKYNVNVGRDVAGGAQEFHEAMQEFGDTVADNFTETYLKLSKDYMDQAVKAAPEGFNDSTFDLDAHKKLKVSNKQMYDAGWKEFDPTLSTDEEYETVYTVGHNFTVDGKTRSIVMTGIPNNPNAKGEMGRIFSPEELDDLGERFSEAFINAGADMEEALQQFSEAEAQHIIAVTDAADKSYGELLHLQQAYGDENYNLAEEFASYAEGLRDLKGPIQQAAQIQKDLTKGGQTANFAALAAADFGDSIGVEAQFQQLVNDTFNSEDFQKALDKAKENGQITATTINAVKDEFSDLNGMLEIGEVNSGALAFILQEVNDGTLSLTDANEALLTSLTKLTEIDSAIADTMQRLDDSNIGPSETDAISGQGNKFYSATKEIAERGAWGDSQLDDYMNALLGEETWASYANNPDYNRKEAYEAAIKDAGYVGSGESIYYNQLLNKQNMADGLYSAGSNGIEFDFSHIEKGTTVAEALAEKLKISKEQAKQLEAYCALLSPDFKKAADEVNKNAANINFLKKSVTNVREETEDGKKVKKGNIFGSKEQMQAMAKANNFDTIEEYIDSLNELSNMKLEFIDTKKLDMNSKAVKKWKNDIADAAKSLNNIDEDKKIDLSLTDDFENQFAAIATEIQYYIDKGVSASNIAKLLSDQFASVTPEMKDSLIAAATQAYGKDSAAVAAIKAGYKSGSANGTFDAVPFIESVQAALAQNNASQLAQSVNTALSNVHGQIKITPDKGGGFLWDWLVGDGITLTIDANATVHDPGKVEVPSIEDLGLDFGDLGDNEGGGTVGDDPNANGDSKGGGGGGSGSDKDKEDPRDIRNQQELNNLERERNRLEKEYNELQEGGLYTLPLRLKQIKKEIDLLERERKIQQRIVDDKKDIVEEKKKEAAGWEKYLEPSHDGKSLDYNEQYVTDSKNGKLSVEDEKLQELVEASNEYAEEQEKLDDIDYRKDEYEDEYDNSVNEAIDQGVDWINTAIDGMGQVAQSVISMIEKVSQSMVDGFKSFLGWLTIRIDDEHDIGELDASLKNRKELLDWEFDKYAEQNFDYTKGVNSKSQENLFENLNDAAQNVIIRLQNQRRLYENSFRQLEDLGTNINSDIEASLEEMYEALYGINGVFTKINDKVQYLENRFERATHWNLTNIREMDPIAKINEWFGTNFEDTLGNALEPLSIFDGTMIDTFFKKSLQQIAGLDVTEYRLGDVGESLLQKVANFFYELSPKFDADYQIVNKSELVDALNQKMQTIITNDTITSQFVQNYLDYLTEIESQMESEVENIRNAESEILSLYDEMTEILEKGKDEYSELEQAIYDAIVNEKESIKEELEELNSNITDADSDLIQVLKDNLEQMRQMRENDKTESDLQDKEARLAYLKQDTSGANKQEILKLEKELKEGQQSYTDKLIDQKISELEKQNEEAAEQRQIQIDLLQEEINNTKNIWETVKSLMDGISGYGSWDDLLKGEIKREAYQAIIDRLKKSSDFEDKSLFSQDQQISDWGVLIRKASLYGTMLKDEYQEAYNDLKILRDILDQDTKLPSDNAADSMWHNYVAFSNLETAVQDNTTAVKNAVSVINRIVDAKTLSFDETGSIFKKATESGATIQALSGLEDAVKNFANDMASGLPQILTQLTTGTGNITKGMLKGMGAMADSAAGSMSGDIEFGDLGEAAGMLMEGVSNFFAAGVDAVSLMCDIIGDTSPGFTDMGVAAGTLIANWLDNAFEEVDDHLRENVGYILDEMYGEEIDGARLGGYYEQIGEEIAEQKEALLQYFDANGKDGDEFVGKLYAGIEERYKDINDQISKLDGNDIEGFNKQYSRFLALQKILEKIGHTETIETYTSNSISNLNKWAGEIGSLFAELSEKERQIVVDAINNAIYEVIKEEKIATGEDKTSIWESNLKFKTSDIKYYNDIYKEFVDNVNYSVDAIDEAITAINSVFYDPYENEYTSPSAQLLVRKLEQLEGKRAEQEVEFNKSVWETFIDKASDAWGEFGNKILQIVDVGKGVIERIAAFLEKTFGAGSRWDEFINNTFTAHALGGAITRSQRALVGELGPELVQHADGTASIVGRYGPTVADLEAGDMIYNAKQTQEILRKKGKIDFNRFAEGTVGTFMARAPFLPGLSTIDIATPTKALANGQSTRENYFNLNLSLEGLTVDSVDRVDEVANRVWDKLNTTISSAVWPYNKL